MYVEDKKGQELTLLNYWMGKKVQEPHKSSKTSTNFEPTNVHQCCTVKYKSFQVSLPRSTKTLFRTFKIANLQANNSGSNCYFF